ncbi:MAG: Carbohydrate binding family 6 [Clostridiales bacterium]|nr:Carbohydrate binding family 6 [Clostridiales bacterium]
MLKKLKKIIAKMVIIAMMCTLVSTNVTATVVNVGVTENAPSDSIIAALKPSSWRICDKWDTLAVGDRINNIASSNGYTTELQDILSDYIFYNYGSTEKPGPFNDAYYAFATNQYLTNHQGQDMYAIDIYNEPDGWPYPQGALNTREKKSNYWNICYRTIRANPNYNNVKIIGPSISGSNLSTITPYLDDAYASGTYPDIITFHFPDLSIAESQIQAVRDYCTSKGYPSRPIHINEDIYDGQFSYPGTVARMFGYAERMNVKVNHGCWNDGGNNNGDWFPMLDGLVDMNGNTRPCYWMYKAYADMTGSMLNVTKSANFDGPASKTTNKVVAILGSHNDSSGAITAKFDNMSSVFSGSSVNVMVQKLSPGLNPTSGPVTYYSGPITISNNTLSVNVNVNSREGVIITLTTGSVSGNAVYQAENATLSGGAVVQTDHAGYDWTGFVGGYYNSTTAQTSFTVNAPTEGNYNLDLRYSAGNGTNTNTGLYVNGIKVKNITCNGTSNWDTWGDEIETVALNAGNNTIMYKAESASTACLNLDYISIKPTVTKFEAENANLGGNANIASEHSGYSGTGFVGGYYNSTSAATTFTVTAPVGNYNLTLRYSAGNGASTNTGLYVNGIKIKNITCNGTSNWDTWANQTETVTLNAGNNIIMYKADTASTAPINLDYINVINNSIPPAATKVDDRDGSMSYLGTWSTETTSGCYNSTERASNTTGNYAQLTANTTSFKLAIKKHAWAGNADIYIDGVLDATIDCYASGFQYQQLVYTKSGLAPGSHTIKIVVKGTKNANSQNYYLNVDYIEVVQ